VVGKTSVVTIDRVRYSVPVTYVGRTLRAESFVDRVEVFDDSSRVALHVRRRARNGTVLDLTHYLDAFEPKAQGRALMCRARERGPGVHDRARHGPSHT